MDIDAVQDQSDSYAVTEDNQIQTTLWLTSACWITRIISIHLAVSQHYSTPKLLYDSQVRDGSPALFPSI